MLDRVGSGWIGLDRVGSGWIALGRAGSGWIASWVGSGRVARCVTSEARGHGARGWAINRRGGWLRRQGWPGHCGLRGRAETALAAGTVATVRGLDTLARRVGARAPQFNEPVTRVPASESVALVADLARLGGRWGGHFSVIGVYVITNAAWAVTTGIGRCKSWCREGARRGD